MPQRARTTLDLAPLSGGSPTRDAVRRCSAGRSGYATTQVSQPRATRASGCTAAGPTDRVEVDELGAVVGVPGLHLGGCAGEVDGVTVGLVPAEDLAEGGSLLDDKVIFTCGHTCSNNSSPHDALNRRTMMRELLYVSDAKLKSFVDDGRRLRLPKVSGEGEVSVLEALKLKFSISGSDRSSDAATLREVLKRVDKVIKHLDNSDQPPVWYEDVGQRPGYWVQFEAHMAYLRDREMFMMWSSPIVTGGIALVLHGSARHLLDDELREAGNRYDIVRHSDWPIFENSFRRFVERFADSDGSSEMVSHRAVRRWWRPKAKSQEMSSDRWFDEKVKRDLVRSWYRFDSSIVTGFARVTYVGPKSDTDGIQVLAATPLYVERL